MFGLVLKIYACCSRRLFLLCVLIFSAHTALNAQADDTRDLLATAKKQLYTDTEKALKTTDYLLKNAQTDQEKAMAGNLRANIYIIKGEYSAALEELAAVANINAGKKVNSDIALTTARLLRVLGLYELAGYYLDKATAGGDSKTGNDINAEKAALLIATGDYANAIPVLKKVTSTCLNQKDFEGAFFSLVNTAGAYSHVEKTGYFHNSLALCIKAGQLAKTHGLPQLEVYALQTQCGLLMQQKQYAAANGLASVLLPQAEKTSDALLKRDVYKYLADSYAALGNLDKYSQYNREYDLLDDALIKETEKANTAFSAYIEKEGKAREIVEQEHFGFTSLLVWGSTGLLLLCGAIYFFLLGREGRQYRSLLAQLEAKPVTTAEMPSPETKSYAIPEKTEKALLEKLERFEASGRYTKNTLSLNMLARQMDTNTKYLSEIINTHKGGNFNAYINELRIKYILKKLQAEPVYLQYKVSYLAEECGFSSHSAFATVFKSVTGFSPTGYISMLRKETELTPL